MYYIFNVPSSYLNLTPIISVFSFSILQSSPGHYLHYFVNASRSGEKNLWILVHTYMYVYDIECASLLVPITVQIVCVNATTLALNKYIIFHGNIL